MKCFVPVWIMLPAILFFCSCQKNLPDPTVTGSDGAAFAPKQMIISDATSPSLKQYYSLKYAADKSRIDLYLDDTTNSNPYDMLTGSYIFNNGGYLVKTLSQSLGSSSNDSDSVFITRGADNKIISITESFRRPGVRKTNDTSIFNYASAGTGTTIAVSRVSVNNDDLGGISVARDTNMYTYDAANKLQQVKKNPGRSTGGIYTCSYNANGSVQSIHYGDNNNGSVDAGFSYSSGLPDSKEDYLAKLLLGKDYYLQDITNFPATGSNFDELTCCVISITNPQHVSKMHVVSNLYGASTQRDYNFTYQQNKNLLPVSVFESGHNQLTEFRY